MRDFITTALEVAGLVLFAAAVAVYLTRFDLALGLGGAAATLVLESLVVTAIAPKPRGEGE